MGIVRAVSVAVVVVIVALMNMVVALVGMTVVVMGLSFMVMVVIVVRFGVYMIGMRICLGRMYAVTSGARQHEEQCRNKH